MAHSQLKDHCVNQIQKKASNRIPRISNKPSRRRFGYFSSFSSLAAFTLVATYLASSATAFTSTGTIASRTVVGTRSRTPALFRANVGPPKPFLVSATRLFSSQDPNADSDEWRAVMAALQLYKAAFGDLKIPVQFVVPSMKPWPQPTWGMKLGKKVGQIRSTGKYVDNNPRRRQQLEKIGFVWRVRAQPMSARDNKDIPFDQVYDALCVYRKEMCPSGPLDVPLQFTIPNSDPWPEHLRGLPLGRCVEKLRSKTYLKKNPGAEEKLYELGFELEKKVSANDVRFQNVVAGLDRYKEIYGDLLVPQPFSVPKGSPDWPEETWGLRLGARVNAIRSQGTFIKNDEGRRQILDDLGFVWTPPVSERRRKGRPAKEDTDEDTDSDTAFPADSASNQDDAEIESFVASFDFSNEGGESTGEETIAPTWGFEGGSDFKGTLAAAQEEAAQQVAQDVYEPPQTLGESLENARLRAIEVGIVEEGSEGGKTLKKGKRERDIPWFNDDFGDDFVFEDVVEALTLYKSFYGSFANLTNEDFVIPLQGGAPSPFDSEDEFDNGGMFENDPSARAAAAIARFDELDDLSMTEDMIEAEISRFEGEALDPEVTEKAAVATLTPVKEVNWPEHLGGMLLGNIVARIRDGSLEVKHLPERKAQLDAIDFDWGDPKYFIDVPFEKAMCAMYAYYLVRGDMFVPPEYVMPDEDPWPKALAGYEIGNVVKRIRELQNFMEAYHTDKVGLLRMIDFVWFPTLALPIDPNEPEMTPEMLKLSGMGHPDYAKMIDVPMGLPEKIIADGPFLDSDDPKMWWRKWHNWDYVKDYWYENGRRDNAFVLKGMGYEQMAEEHEEKYGPGLFTQIEETLDRLEFGGPVESPEEKALLMENMKYFRAELEGCKDVHPDDLEELVEEIDLRMLELVTGKRGATTEDLEAVVEEYEEELEEDAEEEELEGEGEYEEEDVEYEEQEEYEDEDFDIEEQLGLEEEES